MGITIIFLMNVVPALFYLLSLIVSKKIADWALSRERKNMENQNMEVVTETEEMGPDTNNVQEPTEKLFTQEQVNEIIKKRLKGQKDIESRAAELTARESKLSCREYIMEKGYPAELLDIIDTSDVEAFKNKADKASGVFESKLQSQFVAPLASTEDSMHGGDMSAAFENTKHTPKQYPPR